MGIRRFLVLCWLASLCVVGVDAAVAQTWPAARPITMVVPFPPGPALDLVARLVGGKLSDALGQTVVVENRSGANGTIGASLVARATPDGYNLLAATAGTHVAAVEPVTCLVVHSAVPVDTVEELIAYARSHPDELSYGSSGLGSVFHMMGELFNQTAGVRIKHVPYRGVAPAMQTGRVKILAVLEPTRYPKLSQVRSMSEIVSAFQKPSSWFGFFGPAGLPREIVTRLNIEMVKSLNASDVRGKLEDNGMTVIGGTPEQFGALMQDGIVRYGAIIKATGRYRRNDP